MSSRKERIRQQMRLQRRSLSPAQRERLAHGLYLQLIRSPLFLRSQRIACYFANDGEMALHQVVDRIWQMGKECYLPAIEPLFRSRLTFVRHLPDKRLVVNRYGIPEPRSRHCQTADPWVLDLLLLPLVAFDNMGNRLGMGGGYYDRTLSYLRHRREWRTPVRLGIGYSFQEIDEVPSEPWDIPLDGVVTESGIKLF